MESPTVRQILRLNANYYQSTAHEFSATRNRPWKGWLKLVPTLSDFLTDKPKSFLDLGCGNGRFLDFLQKNFPSTKYSYYGVDNNDVFLDICKQKFSLSKYAKFKNLDIFTNLGKLNKTYDIVAGFGITHHIPTQEFRNKWFSKLPTILNSQGLLLLSFWNLEPTGDTYLKWKYNPLIKRFVHTYDEKEIQALIESYSDAGLALINDFIEDKLPKSFNRYLIFKKG